MQQATRTQVVIAGAGPVGTVAAYYLARHGIDVVLLERGDDCAQDLRASTFHPPTLEMLDELDITQDLLRVGLKAPIYHFRERATGEVFEFDLSEIGDRTRYPFRLQCEQYHLSRMLADRLSREPTASVAFQHRLLSFTQDADGVDVYAEGPLEIARFRADYLIGADGANSIVRKWLGIEFEGFTYPEKFLCLTTEEPLDQALPNLCAVNYVSDPEEWLVLLRVPSLWRVLVPASDTQTDAYLLSDEKKGRVFGNLVGKPQVKTEHRTIYRVHQRVARTFRQGRVMIIGDAAHLNNPLGGFGMNSGIHDAFNLCGKLVQILSYGGPADALLESFARQRHEITHDFIQAQTIQNIAYLKEGNENEHQLRRQAMKATLADPNLRREYLLRQAMIESLREPATNG